MLLTEVEVICNVNSTIKECVFVCVCVCGGGGGGGGFITYAILILLRVKLFSNVAEPVCSNHGIVCPQLKL